jgi:hypothetical protein
VFNKLTAFAGSVNGAGNNEKELLTSMAER